MAQQRNGCVRRERHARELEPLALRERRDAPRAPGPEISRYGRDIAASGRGVMRHIGRHLGFLAGLLLAGVVFGIAYRYLFDRVDQRTPQYFIRSCLHAIGLTCTGWAVHVTLAAAPRSRLGGALRRLRLAAEFAV
jgi:hypothetical protein